MSTGVIDRFTDVFTRYIDSGFGLLGGEVAFLASTLIVIDVSLAGLFWAWAAEGDVLAHLVKKTLYVGFFAFLIGNFNALAKIVFNSFAGLGLKAAGSALSGRSAAIERHENARSRFTPCITLILFIEHLSSNRRSPDCAAERCFPCASQR
jgi:P-type conjugative transfer protein TrbL